MSSLAQDAIRRALAAYFEARRPGIAAAYLVRGYDTVNLDVVRDVLEHRLGNLLAFAAAVPARLRRA